MIKKKKKGYHKNKMDISINITTQLYTGNATLYGKNI